jgi:hypothetical protein
VAGGFLDVAQRHAGVECDSHERTSHLPVVGGSAPGSGDEVGLDVLAAGEASEDLGAPMAHTS